MYQIQDDPNFYINRNENIAKRKIPNLILAGDWNLVLDLTIDYYNYKRTNNVKSPKEGGRNCVRTTV